MLCRVEMPTNEQIFGRFYRYKMTRKGAPGRGSLIFLPILVVAAAVFMYFSGFGLVVPAVLVALVAAYLIFTLFIKPGQLFRKKGGAALQTEVYIFTETGFTRSVRSEEGGLPENYSGQYTVLVNAVETGNDFYLFTGPNQAYLVDKEYFTKGSPEELRETLQKRLGKKFKGKK